VTLVYGTKDYVSNESKFLAIVASEDIDLELKAESAFVRQGCTAPFTFSLTGMEASSGSTPILAVGAISMSALVTPLRCPITQNMDDRS